MQLVKIKPIHWRKYFPLQWRVLYLSGVEIFLITARAMCLQMLRYDLSQPEAADDLEAAVEAVLDKGLRTGDILQPGCTLVVRDYCFTFP